MSDADDDAESDTPSGETTTAPVGREDVWVEKYRPEQLDDVVGHEAIIERVQAYVSDNDLSNLLFAGPAGTGKCVTGDTPVLTTQGLRPIEQVVGDVEGAAPAPDDLQILSFEQGAFQYHDPEFVFSKSAEKTVTITTQDGSELTVTPEHKLLVLTDTGISWKPAAAIEPDDHIARPRSMPLPTPSDASSWLHALDPDRVAVSNPETTGFVPLSTLHQQELTEILSPADTRIRLEDSTDPITPPTAVTPQLATFLGLLAGNGTVTSAQLRFETADPALSEQFATLATELFDVATLCDRQGETSVVRIRNRTLGYFLATCVDVCPIDQTSSTEATGSVLLTAGEESITAFLRALFETVGTVSDTGSITFADLDQSIATLVAYLLTGLGIPTAQSSTADGWTVTVVDQYRQSFRDRVGLSVSSSSADAPLSSRRRSAIATLCQELHIDPEQLPDRPADSLAAFDHLLDLAADRIETAQCVLDPTVSVTADNAVLTPTQVESGASTTVTGSSGPAGSDDLSAAVGNDLGTLARRLGLSVDALVAHTDLPTSVVHRCLDMPTAASEQSVDAITDAIQHRATELCSQSAVAAIVALDRLLSDELYFDPVIETDTNTTSKRMYDLTVPGPRNYVAGQVPAVMHNTTTALAIAKEIYGDDWQEHFLELNASDERGIDVVRGRIKEFARSSFGGYDFRIIFLDEADALCVPPGTEVITGSPSAPEITPIEDVAADGEPVPSVDFDTNTIQADTGRRVDSGVADFFELSLVDGRTITASLTHPFFVVGDDGRLVERELRELRPGDTIADFKNSIGATQDAQSDTWTVDPSARSDHPTRLVADGARQTVDTVAIQGITYSHRGKAYNISMDGTPNFMLANGILTHNTSDAQSALRRTMEQFSGQTRFILSCNYSSRIIDPIQSRCAVFRFSPLSDEAIIEQARRVADAEGLAVTDDGFDAVAYVADGDMRRAINALQAAAVSDPPIDEAAVYAITSTARPEEVIDMAQAAIDGDFMSARSQLESLLVDRGIAGGDVLDQLHRSVWDLNVDDQTAVRLMDRIGEAEYRIVEGADERIQLEAMLASLALD